MLKEELRDSDEGQNDEGIRFQILVEALAPYGLTPNQAKLYLYLLGRESTSAGEISRRLGIHRVDVYRKLRELGDLGLLDLYIGSPRRFTAVDPKNALSSILKKKESELLALKNVTHDVQSALKGLEMANKARMSRSEVAGTAQSYYRFSKGRESYLREMKQLIRSSKYEIIKITSGNGLKRAFLLGLTKEYKQAADRGVSIRMIGEVRKDNLVYAKKLAKVVQLRHVRDADFRFIVVDHSITMLSAQYDDGSMSGSGDSDSYFVLSDPIFAKVMCFLFKHLWEGSGEIPSLRYGRRGRSATWQEALAPLPTSLRGDHIKR